MLYTPEFLGSLSDSALAALLFDAIVESGEDGGDTLTVKAEIKRRRLTDKQVSEAYFTGQVSS